MPPSSPRASLLQWHAEHGRHDLPWRQARDPYRIMVSEFMLQQTTVATVQPRFKSWILRFPTILDLATANEEEVLQEWQGLGYYSRARRLHAAARAIAQDHRGIVPSTKEELLNLPGIGDYTAEAILAFAYDLPAIVLDTNISRVIARWSNLTTPIDTADGKLSLRECSRAFFQSKPSRAVASALMDLGARVCVAGKPRCKECPIKNSCKAEVPTLLPKKSPRAVTTKLTEYRAWIFHNGRLYLELSRGPLWKGLWILPELAEVPSGRCVAQLTYPITRYRVLMKVYPGREPGREPMGGALKGFAPEELAMIAIPSPHRRAIAKAGIPVHTSV